MIDLTTPHYFDIYFDHNSPLLINKTTNLLPCPVAKAERLMVKVAGKAWAAKRGLLKPVVRMAGSF